MAFAKLRGGGRIIRVCHKGANRVRLPVPGAGLKSLRIGFDTQNPMPHSALPEGEESSRQPESGARLPGLTEALRRALTELDASAVGVTRAAGGPPKYFTRSAAAAQFFEDICVTGLESLKAQTQAKDGVYGTNRVRADSTGPVRGRLIAISLRSDSGLPLGMLIAVRLIEEAKFGARESQKLLALAKDFAAALAPQRAVAAPVSETPPAAAVTPEPIPAATPTPSRSMWPIESAPTPAKAAAEDTTPPITFEVDAAMLDSPVSAVGSPAVAESAPVGPAPLDVQAISVPSELPAYPEAVAPVPASTGVTEPLPSDVAARLLEQAAEPRVDPADTVASLLDWTSFERQIRVQEALDRLPGCVLYGDMDQLHVLNKLAGFAVGDLAISEVGAALQTSELPQGSCGCHLSGDRFTVYAPRTTLAQGRRLAEQLSKRVAGLSVAVHGVPSPLSISFGVALIPSSEGGLGHALAAAEAACKAAKDRGRGRTEVYQDADQSIVRRNDDVLVADRLRQALDAGRVEVFAQPIVGLQGALENPHYELLVRLIGEAGTHLSPTWFMSAATRYRMLVELDRAVVAHVLGKLEERREALTKKKLCFSVNLSGPTIGDPDFLEWISPRIGGGGVPGEWLQFEITETAAVANVMQTQAMIRRLQARGVQFALDDFGTGVSSFAYLKFFDVSMLKLDGSFVRDLLSNSRSESLVRGIAQLGRGMNIVTVAECVETGAVRDRLTELGIDCAQGFLFGRPRPLDAVLAEEFAETPVAATPAA
jgi:diguanylate cyclase (GGDEF)-like protein